MSKDPEKRFIDPSANQSITLEQAYRKLFAELGTDLTSPMPPIAEFLSQPEEKQYSDLAAFASWNPDLWARIVVQRPITNEAIVVDDPGVLTVVNRPAIKIRLANGKVETF